MGEGSIDLPSFHRRRSAMAVINRNTLVLNGVSVVRDVVTGTMGNGLDQVMARTSTSPFTTRQSSQRTPQAVHEYGPRHDHAYQLSMADARDRAGRPGCPRG